MPRWFLWTLAALLSWGLWAVASKLIGDALSPAHSQALSTLGMLPVMALLAARPRPATTGNRNRGLTLAFAAGLVTCLGNLAYYDALQRGSKAATVIPLTALYPVVTIVLALVLLRERLGKPQIAGIALSLAATWLFNIPSAAGFFSPALTLALPPIILWGIAGLLQKVSTQHVPGEACALAFLAAFIPVALLILAREPLPTDPIPTRIWTLAAALGLCLAFGNYAILAAFASGGKASMIAPLGGLYPLVSVPIALAFLGEQTTPRELAGLALALASVAAASIELPSPAPSPATPAGRPNPSPNAPSA